MTADKRLHWTQRVALVRHNLHAASRTSDFTFFRVLQAHSLLEGIDHVATLTTQLGDGADTVLSTLDNLNAGVAYVHQDAFKNVYNSVKAVLADDDANAKLQVDASQQKQMADHAIDRMTTSAVQLIQTQPVAAQEAAASVWITGVTIIADTVQIALEQIERISNGDMDDFIQLEDAWSIVSGAVGSSVSALKGIFSLMTTQDTPTSSDASAVVEGQARSRPNSGSFSYAGGMFRRLSTALSSSSTSSTSPRLASIPTPSTLRASISHAFPTAMPPPPLPPKAHFQGTQLNAVIPTPDLESGNPFDSPRLGPKQERQEHAYVHPGADLDLVDLADKHHLDRESVDPLERNYRDANNGDKRFELALPGEAKVAQITA